MRPEHWLFTIPLRLRSLFRWAQADQELDDELLDHLERKTEEYVAQGMTREEARRRARLDLGGIEQTKEKCREARPVNWIHDLIQDIRYALRGFRRAPLFAVSVVATIALGLGINTALFTVFNAYYFRPVDVRDPRSLYAVAWRDRAGSVREFSWPEYQQFLKENPSFSEAIAYQPTEARMNGRHAFGLLVTGDYFRVLGVDAALGRTLLPEDASVSGREAVVVLSAVAWQTRFGADPEIVGKKITLRGYPFRVVGVAKPGFRGVGDGPADFWAPLTVSALLQTEPDVFGPDTPRSVSVIGRLRPGHSLSQCRASVSVWMERATNAPQPERASQAILTSQATDKPWHASNLLTFSPILIAFSLVLLIACANVANMTLARSLSRQREFGIRVSLGASQRRLIRQLLTESALLAIPAAAAGILVSQASISLGTRLLFATLPPGIADFANRLPTLSPDMRVFAYNLAAAFVAALLFGLAPARQATRMDVLQATRGDFTTRVRPARLRDGLVLGQVTACVLLLITTGVLLRGANEIKGLDSGLSRRDTIEIRVNERFRARIIDRILSDPSIEVLAAASASPLDRKQTRAAKADQGGAAFPIATNSVSPEYFNLFDLPILLGRNFTSEEARSGAAVAVISETTAKLLWPKQVAVGRALRMLPDARTNQAALVATVIGVARDDIAPWINNGDDKTLVYLPSTPQNAANILFVAPRGDVEPATRALDPELSAIDPTAIEEMRKFQIRESVAEDAAYSFRVAYWLSLAIGILALLLTLSGIYGVVAFVVSQRTKEIGIRMALGATRTAVSGMVLQQSMRLALMGTAVGGLLAAGISKILASILVMINTFDTAAYSSGAFLVLLAAGMAAYFPSRRATKVDPMVVLRYE